MILRKSLKMTALMLILFLSTTPVRGKIVLESYEDAQDDVDYIKIISTNSSDTTPEIDQKSDFRYIDLKSTSLKYDSSNGEFSIILTFYDSIELDLDNTSPLVGSISYEAYLIHEYNCFLTECDSHLLHYVLEITRDGVVALYSNYQLDEVDMPLDYFHEDDTLTFKNVIDDDDSVNIITREDKADYNYNFDSVIEYEGTYQETARDWIYADHPKKLGFSTSYSIDYTMISIVILPLIITALYIQRGKHMKKQT